MKLQNQSHCHVHLIKYIASCISFEVVRDYRKKQIHSNLERYRVPLTKHIIDLNKNFYSLNLRAR